LHQQTFGLIWIDTEFSRSFSTGANRMNAIALVRSPDGLEQRLEGQSLNAIPKSALDGRHTSVTADPSDQSIRFDGRHQHVDGLGLGR
jgi:hypothetical protein